MQWYIKCLKNYVTFSGRAQRAEYWYFVLFNLLVGVALSLVDMLLGTYDSGTGNGLLAGIYTLAVFLPGLAVTIRRLHDIDRRGWWVLIIFVPLIGILVLLFFMIKDSGPDNRFGPNPKGMIAQAA